MIRKGIGSRYYNAKNPTPVEPPPEPLGDYLLCEALGFAVLPWELDDLPLVDLVYWSGVIGTWISAKNKQEYKRQQEDAARAKAKSRRR